jgi:hypothetical protein
MDNRITALIIIVIVLLIAGVVAFTYTAPSAKTNNTTVNTNITNNNTAFGTTIKVFANQTGPATAKKGDNITINYTITNKGEQAVYNVKTHAQNFDTTIGTLNPGETKNYQYKLHIPTDEEIQKDFNPNGTVSNPLFIGGFGVSFSDVNGSTHTINANSLEIKLS